MSYFAAALVALLATEGLMAAGYGFPSATIEAPETLILVHVAAIGWLSLLLCGALFQFVPVLIARPLHDNALPAPTLLLLLAGLVTLLLGFGQIGGAIDVDIALLPVAGVLLATGFALVLWNLGRTLATARPLPLPARFVVVGLCCLAATVALGLVFTLALGGVTESQPLLDLTLAGVPIHVAAGVGGWLTFTAMGVSYRLLAMFMLAPENEGATTRGALHLGGAALAIAILGGAAAAMLHGGRDAALGIAAILGTAALTLYGRDMAMLYRARRRRIIELNSQMASAALASLAASVLLGAVLIALGELPRHIGAVIFLAGFGWLSGLGLAKLYKIVAFLTWLECYGPVLGKTPTPRVQDLVVERRARRWFLLYFAAVWSATLSLLLDRPPAFRVAAAIMLIATCGIAVQLVRTRRLADVTADRRWPAGTRRPRLLSSAVQ